MPQYEESPLLGARALDSQSKVSNAKDEDKFATEMSKVCVTRKPILTFALNRQTRVRSKTTYKKATIYRIYPFMIFLKGCTEIKKQVVEFKLELGSKTTV
jgi:hypothetical protein